MVYIDIHTHNTCSDADIFILNANIRDVAAGNNLTEKISMGVHPWNSDAPDADCLTDCVYRYADRDNVAAVGECGIDRLRGTDIDRQRELFRRQAMIAKRVNKPLIIHCVKAYSELLAVHKEVNPSNAWIIHGFNQKLQIAEMLISKGIYLSFGAKLTDGRSNAAKIFSKIPKEFIFAETDDEDVSIRDIYSEAAAIRGIDVKSFAEIISTNYKKCFKYV